MENMTVFILGIAILSAGTYLMRLGGAKLGNRLALSERSQALLSDAATGTILPGWRACWGWGSRCFWPGAKCR